jgi:hypothetical protein
MSRLTHQIAKRGFKWAGLLVEPMDNETDSDNRVSAGYGLLTDRPIPRFVMDKWSRFGNISMGLMQAWISHL